eukprot:scaffold203470_cov30-Tisochrysis_lutea.AAC.1
MPGGALCAGGAWSCSTSVMEASPITSERRQQRERTRLVTSSSSKTVNSPSAESALSAASSEPRSSAVRSAAIAREP